MQEGDFVVVMVNVKVIMLINTKNYFKETGITTLIAIIIATLVNSILVSIYKDRSHNKSSSQPNLKFNLKFNQPFPRQHNNHLNKQDLTLVSSFLKKKLGSSAFLVGQ
jgi:hypothetical protein